MLGDVPLSEVGAEHLLQFRRWWWDKVKAEGLTKNSANKDFAYVSSTLRRVNADLQLGLTLRFDQMAFTDTQKATRSTFSAEWIKEKILAPGALDGLNLEARCIRLGMVNTGYRPSEAQGILPHHIHLDGDVPYIEFKPEGRQLKTATSARKIPLAGISLEAFRLCPQGFPRYRDKAGLSETINKFLRENKLLQTVDHSLYGLRHNFEDRLLAQNLDERIRRDLMGHALDRQR